MKKSIIALIISLSIVILPSCARMSYADDVACEDIGDSIKTSLDESTEYSLFDRAHIDKNLDVSGEYDDFYAIYSTDTNDIDEIGIFHAPTKEDAEDMAEACRDYVEDMQEDSRAFIASYAPEELPKLDDAQVRRFGNYVVYTVLPEDTANAVFESIKEALKK